MREMYTMSVFYRSKNLRGERIGESKIKWQEVGIQLRLR